MVVSWQGAWLSHTCIEDSAPAAERRDGGINLADAGGYFKAAIQVEKIPVFGPAIGSVNLDAAANCALVSTWIGYMNGQ